MAAFLDVCRYSPTAGGTTDWTYSAAITGYQSPTAAGVVNGRAYKYRAESADLSQWEVGEGTYNTGTGVLSRTTVLFNSSGTTAKINFSTIPQVAIVALKEDLISVEEANSFTTAQKLQARTNILAALSPAFTTSQSFLSGSGTYTTPAGCAMIEIYMQGGGGGGAGSGTSPGNGGAGGNTTFSTFTANGGAGATASLGGSGGSTTGGFGITGGSGQNGSGVNNTAGGNGGCSFNGGVGWGGAAGAGAGVAAVTNSGSGGGGGGVNVTVNGGGGGGAGGYIRAFILSPAASYSYAVGGAGTAGTTGTGGAAGGAGGSGSILVIENY